MEDLELPALRSFQEAPSMENSKKNVAVVLFEQHQHSDLGSKVILFLQRTRWQLSIQLFAPASTWLGLNANTFQNAETPSISNICHNLHSTS
jgi:hypothetical protein